MGWPSTSPNAPPLKIRGGSGGVINPSILADSRLVDLGLTEYRFAHGEQLKIHSNVALRDGREKIIITEHSPVYTCGRRTKSSQRPWPGKIPVLDVERGGELTYHGPGQIVGYPILHLVKRRLSVPGYLRLLEKALAQALMEVGVATQTRPECLAGLWVGEKKVVSIGIAVKRWVTLHGFALNVNCDLTPFRKVQPCGLPGDRITSLKELGCEISPLEMKEIVCKYLLKTLF